MGVFMATGTVAARERLGEADKDLSAFCEDLFSSFPRSDQRQWGEVYIRGLLSVPGRKSIRRISEQVAGRRADQNLQQFVNQSPWQWNDVRRALAHRASPLRPKAWLVHEAIFPKHGHASVGVDRQYVPSLGRTLNCQLGLAVSVVSDAERCMLNWRLVLPSSWDLDRERRTRARVPDDVRHMPHWRYVLDSVDEMTNGWGLRPAPIVWNAIGQETRPLLPALTARRLPYLVQVSPDAPVTLAGPGSGPVLTAGELAAIGASRRHLMVRGRDRAPGASVQYSLLSFCDLCPPDERVHVTRSCHHGGTRRVLAQWSRRGDGGHLTGVWLTNLVTARLPQLVDLVELRPRAQHEDMTALRENFGLQDFEGRSFVGWHHHVTLVSAAHGYRMLRRARHMPAGRTSSR
jgi:hypothetical protein